MKKWIALMLSLSMVLGLGAASADGWLDWLFGDEPAPSEVVEAAASVEAAVEETEQSIAEAIAAAEQAIAEAVAEAEATAAEAVAEAEEEKPAPAEMSPAATVFQSLLDGNGLYYTYAGKMEDGSDHFYLTFGNDARSYDVDIYLLDDGTHAEVRVWNLIDYNASSFSDVVKVVDSLNGTYKYVTFQTDSTDHSVTVSMDLIFGSLSTPEQAADITMEALIRTVQIVRDAYSYLEPYKK